MPPKRVVRTDPEFGKRFRLAMEYAGVAPGDLAEAEHVRPQTVSRWRRGELPDDLRLPRLAALFRVEAEWLRTGQGPAPGITGTGGVQIGVVMEGGSSPYAASAEEGEGIGWLWADAFAAKERVLGLLANWEHAVRTSNTGFDPVGLRADILDGLVAQARATGNPPPPWLIALAYDAARQARR
ncbi:MAG: helix-turn-helix transcriptional regulator [Gemmatimonadetes bacterium]|nr:helix-turn-helix transcriptional regulator [Gemmatimonadota bacterium]